MTNKHNQGIWLKEYSGCLASHYQEVHWEITPQREKIIRVWKLKIGIIIYNYKWGKIKQQNVIRKLSQSQNEMPIIHILKVFYWLKLRLLICSNVEKNQECRPNISKYLFTFLGVILIYILFNLLFWQIILIHNLILDHLCTSRINSTCS